VNQKSKLFVVARIALFAIRSNPVKNQHSYWIATRFELAMTDFLKSMALKIELFFDF
jgi:hypothetical protein